MGHLILDLPFVNNMYYSDFCGENRNHLMCFKWKRTYYREFCACGGLRGVWRSGDWGPPLDCWLQVTAGGSGSYCCCVRTTVSRPSELVTRCWNMASISLKLFPIAWQQEHGLHLTSTYQSSTALSRASHWPNWLMTGALILMVFKKGNF